MQFSCPVCNVEFICPESDAGKTVICPCSQQLIVPSLPPPVGTQPTQPSATPVEFDFDEQKYEQPHSQPTPERSGKGVLAAIIILGVLVVLLLASIGGFLIYQDVRNNNRREFDRLISEVEEINRGLGRMHDILSAQESMMRDLEREGANVDGLKQDIASTRRTIREGERTRDLHIKRAYSLSPK